MTHGATEWEPTAPRAAAPAVAEPAGGVRGFLEFAGDHKAWWIVPALLTALVLALLVLLARGDLHVPDSYRLL